MTINDSSVWGMTLNGLGDSGSSAGFAQGIYFPPFQIFQTFFSAFNKKRNPTSAYEGDPQNSRENWDVGKIEEYLMRLCLEIGERNRLIQVDSLYMVARRDLRAPRIKIEVALDNLIKAKKIIPGQFLSQENVLENETRKLVFDAIAAAPCKYPYDLQKELGFGANIIAWHLKKLLDFGLVKEITFNNKRLFALPRIDDRDAIIFYLVSRNPAILEILSSVLSNSHSIKDVPLNDNNAKRTTRLYHLKNLENWGIISPVAANASEQKHRITERYLESTRRTLDLFHPLSKIS